MHFERRNERHKKDCSCKRTRRQKVQRHSRSKCSGPRIDYRGTRTTHCAIRRGECSCWADRPSRRGCKECVYIINIEPCLLHMRINMLPSTTKLLSFKFYEPFLCWGRFEKHTIAVVFSFFVRKSVGIFRKNVICWNLQFAQNMVKRGVIPTNFATVGRNFVVWHKNRQNRTVWLRKITQKLWEVALTFNLNQNVDAYFY